MSPDTIKHLRQQLNLTQQQFAARLGITRAYLSKLEMPSGQYRPGATLVKLLETLRPPA